MKINELRPMLWTDDLKGTIDFYVDILGLTCVTHTEDWGWASLRLHDGAIMLARPNDHEACDKIGFTRSFYFNTDGVDEAREKLKDKAKVCYGIEDFDYGMREFAIYDNNGCILQFGQEIAA